MTASLCVIPSCGRPSETAMCGGCWAVLEGRDIRTPGLADVAWIADELGTTMSRMDKVGGASVGRVGGAGELPMPVNLKAGEQLRELRAYLAGWVGDLWETFGPHEQRCAGCQSYWPVGEEGQHDIDGCQGDWVVDFAELRVDDEPVALSRWLMRHPTWIKTHTAAADLYDEVLAAIRKARRTVDTTASRTYLGTCSNVVDTDRGPVECPETLYAMEGEREVRCRTCGTHHSLDDRRNTLLAAAEDKYLPTGELVGLVNSQGKRVTSSMIRNLKARGRIKPWVWDDTAGWWRPKTDVDDWVDLFRVGDVIDAITNRYKREVS